MKNINEIEIPWWQDENLRAALEADRQEAATAMTAQLKAKSRLARIQALVADGRDLFTRNSAGQMEKV